MRKFVLKESFLYDVFFFNVVGTVYLRKINCIDYPIGFFFFYIIFIVRESFNSSRAKNGYKSKPEKSRLVHPSIYLKVET